MITTLEQFKQRYGDFVGKGGQEPLFDKCFIRWGFNVEDGWFYPEFVFEVQDLESEIGVFISTIDVAKEIFSWIGLENIAVDWYEYMNGNIITCSEFMECPSGQLAVQ